MRCKAVSLVFLSFSHKMLTGMWEIGDICNLWAGSEESVLDLEGNAGFREEADREFGGMLYDQQVALHLYLEIHCSDL